MTDIKKPVATPAAHAPAAPAAATAVDAKAAAAIDARVEAQTKEEAEQRKAQQEAAKAKAKADLEVAENSLHTRAVDNTLGQVNHFGCAGLYVGKAPQAEKGDSKCPTCDQPLTGGNSRFIPLPFVKPEPGLLVKDPKTGKFFALPHDGSLDLATPQTWLTVVNPETGENFVPPADKAAAAIRRETAGV